MCTIIFFKLILIQIFFRTNDQLVNFLSANKGKNFVKSHGREVQRFIQKQVIIFYIFNCNYNHFLISVYYLLFVIILGPR